MIVCQGSGSLSRLRYLEVACGGGEDGKIFGDDVSSVESLPCPTCCK